MTDDGIGLKLVEYISENKLHFDFEVIDVADNGLNLLTYFHETTQKMLWVDAVQMGVAPGEFKVFTPEQVESQKWMSGMSTHEGDLLKIFELAKRLHLPMPSVKIFGIQPFCVEYGLELSPVLQGRFQEYTDQIVRLMKS